MTKQEIEKEFPYKVEIINNNYFAPEGVLEFWRESTFERMIVLGNESITISPPKRRITYGFKDAELAILFRLKFA